jgi:hypothetical protein
MFISIFFVGLTILFHSLCWWRAKQARPQANYFFTKKALFKGSTDQFTQLIELWVQRNSRLAIYQSAQTDIIVEEKTSLLSYGLFYSFQLKPHQDHWQVDIGVEAKLIPLSFEENPEELKSFTPINEPNNATGS